MKVTNSMMTAIAIAALLCGCGSRSANANNAAANGATANAAATNSAAGNGAAATSNSASASGPAPASEQSGLGDASETVHQIASCILETPEGHYDGPCERVESGGPSFSIRLAGGRAFYNGVTEAVVEVDRPTDDPRGGAAGGSYRHNGELVSAGPLTFRDDCACWVRPNMRVGAQPEQ